MIYDIIVIGGGPAGMTAAIKAKETAPSASVKLIDKNKKLGKKLYATGNGKCNIANTKLDLSCYSSANEFFPFQFVTTDSHNDVMDFFESLGVSSYDDNGYIYPASLQASTIVWALTDRLKILGIENSNAENKLCLPLRILRNCYCCGIGSADNGDRAAVLNCRRLLRKAPQKRQPLIRLLFIYRQRIFDT